MKVRARMERNYLFSQKDLKKLLGIEGDIFHMGLFSGLSPNDVEKGESHDKVVYEIKSMEDLIPE